MLDGRMMDGGWKKIEWRWWENKWMIDGLRMKNDEYITEEKMMDNGWTMDGDEFLIDLEKYGWILKENLTNLKLIIWRLKKEQK